MARENRVPYFLKWVQRFLGLARARPGESWHDSLRIFLEDLEAGGAPDWQVRQAADAVSLYHGQFLESAGGRLTAEGTEPGPKEDGPPSPDEKPPVDSPFDRATPADPRVIVNELERPCFRHFSGFRQLTRIWNGRTSGSLFTLRQKL